MQRNDRLKLGVLHGSELSLLQEMIKIQEHVTTSRESHIHWANHLRFLRVPDLTVGKEAGTI
jgi:hypothetical protein